MREKQRYYIPPTTRVVDLGLESHLMDASGYGDDIEWDARGYRDWEGDAYTGTSQRGASTVWDNEW